MKPAFLTLALVAAAGCGGGGSGPPTSPGPSPSTGWPPVVAAGTFARGPYLQHDDAGVRVVWQTETATAGQVSWLSSTGVVGRAVSGAGTATRHSVVVQPLQPGVRYRYRVSSAAGVLAGADGTTDFAFRAPEPDVLRMVVFGDSGEGSHAQHAVARAIELEPDPPDLVFIAGDVVYPDGGVLHWTPRFFHPYQGLLPSVPFYAVAGNHDMEVESARQLFDVFELPRNGAPGLPPETTFWLERAGVQVIAHDTNLAEAALLRHSVPWHREVARRSATFRLVVQHHNCYCSGTNGPLPPAGMLRRVLVPVYQQTGVDIVLNGHDHLYERTVAIGGVVYVTTGAGGGELYPRLIFSDLTAAFVNDRWSYTFIEARGRSLRLRQVDTTGRTIDTLTITK